MVLSWKRLGGVMIRLPLVHAIFTPMLSSTSIRRKTSSIFGTRWSVVVPLLSNDAQSNPTAPFLEVLVSIVPLSDFPPLIPMFNEPGVGESKFLLTALLIFCSIWVLTFCRPLSIRATALWVVPIFFAKAPWVSLTSPRTAAIRLPIFSICWKYSTDAIYINSAVCIANL